ncbi:hypothetical protein, partial [Gracilibacillus boraciitolerans]|uniref:hypothetical protein n=1 Tax=Gracilibacillus boraciitolerans TaxID=307521 RepID=UPI001F1A320E
VALVPLSESEVMGRSIGHTHKNISKWQHRVFTIYTPLHNCITWYKYCNNKDFILSYLIKNPNDIRNLSNNRLDFTNNPTPLFYSL